MSLQLLMARARMNHQTAPSASHKYWRILATANNGYPTGTQVAELELRATPGGANQANSATPGTSAFASGVSGSYVAAHAFDLSLSTVWFYSISPTVSVPQWIAYGAQAPISVNEIALTCTPPGSADADISMKDFRVQSSDDGAVWTDEWAVTGSTGWAIGEMRVFTRP